MKTFQLTLVALTIAALSTTSAFAQKVQNYHYNSVQKAFLYNDDGFGIQHSKAVAQAGDIRINEQEVIIDDETYAVGADGVYKNAKGKTVNLSFAYKGNKLVQVGVMAGNVRRDYVIEAAATTNAIVQK